MEIESTVEGSARATSKSVGFEKFLPKDHKTYEKGWVYSPQDLGRTDRDNARAIIYGEGLEKSYVSSRLVTVDLTYALKERLGNVLTPEENGLPFNHIAFTKTMKVENSSVVEADCKTIDWKDVGDSNFQYDLEDCHVLKVYVNTDHYNDFPIDVNLANGFKELFVEPILPSFFGKEEEGDDKKMPEGSASADAEFKKTVRDALEKRRSNASNVVYSFSRSLNSKIFEMPREEPGKPSVNKPETTKNDGKWIPLLDKTSHPLSETLPSFACLDLNDLLNGTAATKSYYVRKKEETGEIVGSKMFIFRKDHALCNPCIKTSSDLSHPVCGETVMDVERKGTESSLSKKNRREKDKKDAKVKTNSVYSTFPVGAEYDEAELVSTLKPGEELVGYYFTKEAFGNTILKYRKDLLPYVKSTLDLTKIISIPIIFLDVPATLSVASGLSSEVPDEIVEGRESEETVKRFCKKSKFEKEFMERICQLKFVLRVSVLAFSRRKTPRPSYFPASLVFKRNDKPIEENGEPCEENGSSVLSQ